MTAGTVVTVVTVVKVVTVVTVVTLVTEERKKFLKKTFFSSIFLHNQKISQKSSKTQIVMKLKHSNCDKNHKTKIVI